MVQIELPDQDLEKVDKLVNSGMFSNRESAIKGILENLPAFEEDIKRVEKAKHEVSSFLEIYMGNMLYPGTPVKIVIEGKEVYKIPIKSASDNTGSVFGYVYVDAQTLEVNVTLSTDLRSLPEMSDEELKEVEKVYAIATNYCETHLGNKLIAGAPLKDFIETEEGFKDCFRIVLTGEHGGKTYIGGYLFIDAETLAVEESLFRSKERAYEIIEQLNYHDSALP